MERLRRSFRNSFRRKKPQQLESSKSHQFEADEQAVRNGSCSFPVKYLGCVQVEDSRGMHVCEQALLRLKTQRQKSIKGLLYVSGDGLRVVDDETKGLIVDQTIEKVSFCAPDRNLERGFSYICRDGTTRRWMCHGFLATKDTGERLSHAVGCAFTVCLERKQKRDSKLQETNNNNNSSNSNSTLSHGSNNLTTITTNNSNNNHTAVVNTNSTSASISTISDSNASSLNSIGLNSSVTSNSTNLPFQRTGSFRRVPMIQRIKDPQECKTIDPVPIKEVKNPYAIERPHATPQLLERQGSFRIFNSLNQSSPFKRQLSLRVHSTSNRLERQRNNSLQTPDNVFGRLSNGCTTNNNTAAAVTNTVSNESSNKQETISAMCKELSQGLSLLTELHDSSSFNTSNSITSTVHPLNAASNHNSANALDVASATKKFGQLTSYAEDLFKSLNTPILTPEPYRASPTLSMGSNATTNSLSASKSNTSTQSSVKQTDLDLFAGFEADFDKHFDPDGHPITTNDSPMKAPMNGSKSIDSINSDLNQSNLNDSFNKLPSMNGSVKTISNGPSNDLFDPFDAEWVSLAGRHHNAEYVKNTNPFLMTNPAVKAFEIKM